MKKFLSLTLTLVLVLNVFVGAGILAFAVEDAEECAHIDGTDDYNNFCDLCAEYIGTTDLSMGTQTVSAKDIYGTQKNYMRFVPEESGFYQIFSTSDTDPYAVAYDSSISEIAYNDDFDGFNFFIAVYLEAGETYYVDFRDYRGDAEYSVTIEMHEHSGDIETCRGLLCSCGRYYGETTYEHRLDSYQTCVGYRCVDCQKYFGEASENHNDTDDYKINICFYCDLYIGQDSVNLGKNELFIEQYSYTYVKFTPDESGIYEIYSQSEYNPFIYCFNSDFEELCSAYGENDNNFSLSIVVEAGKTYYFALGDNSNEYELTYFVEKHEQHSDGNDSYVNLCDVCKQYIGNVSAKEGANTVSLTTKDYLYVTFTPSISGLYNIYSNIDSSFDPDIYFYDADWKELTYDSTEGAFNVALKLTAGKTYYIALEEYSKDNNLTYYITLHNSHSDGEDQYNNLCDICYEFLGQGLVLGNSKVNVTEGNYELYEFIPSESGKYIMVSVNSDDACAYLFQMINGYLEHIGFSDDDYNLTYYDFHLDMELVAGEKYYWGFYSYQYEDSFEIRFVKHEECTDTIVQCNGRYCTVCGEYVNNIGDEKTHLWSFGSCMLCGVSIPEDYKHEHKYSWGDCIICGADIPEDYAHKHNWVNGDCRICDEEHDCQVNDWDDDGYCSVCGEDAGFKIIRDGKVTYYKGLTATIEAMQDGDFVVMLENRVVSKDYSIYADVTIDFNGYNLICDDNYEPSVLHIYGDVTFMDSYNGYAEISTYIYVYGDVTFASGSYSHIKLFNDKSFTDVMPECSDVYRMDPSLGPVLVDISEYIGDESWHLIIESDEERHVAGDYCLSKEATCEANAIEASCCIYCDLLMSVRELEGTAGHVWSGNYGEGTKTCGLCHETVVDAVYSDQPARDFVRVAYEVLIEIIIDYIRENFPELYALLQ